MNASTADGLVVAGERNRFRHIAAERSRHDRSHPRTQTAQRFDPMWMNHVRQQNNKGIGSRVNPQRSTGKSGMPKRANRVQLAAITGIRGIDIPPQPAQDRLVRRTSGCRKLPHREGAEHANISQLSLSQQHFRIKGQIISSRKQSGMAGHAADKARSWIMHHPA